MKLPGVSAVQPAKPSQPAAPTPPPGGNIENRQPPREPSPPPARGGEKTSGTAGTANVNYGALRTMQEILGEYPDVSRLNRAQQSELNSRLQLAGLLRPGALLDTTA